MLDRALMLCRHVCNAAIGERREAWRMCGVSVNYHQQKAELPGIKAELPAYGEVHSQILRDVAQRVERAFHTFLRRVKAGETPGYARFHGRNRSHRLTHPHLGNAATLDNGFLVLSKIGRIGVRWSRPLEGAPNTVTISQEADGWYVRCSCVDAPIEPLPATPGHSRPLPATGQETGRDLGIQAFATLFDGARIFSPGWSGVVRGGPGWHRKAARALTMAQRRVSRRKKESNRRRKAVGLLATAHQTARRQRQDFHHTVALRLDRDHDAIHHEDVQVANMVK
jgi:putative transposase